MRYSLFEYVTDIMPAFKTIYTRLVRSTLRANTFSKPFARLTPKIRSSLGPTDDSDHYCIVYTLTISCNSMYFDVSYDVTGI